MTDKIEKNLEPILSEINTGINTIDAKQLIDLLARNHLILIPETEIFGLDSLRHAVAESLEKRTGNIGVSAQLLDELLQLIEEAIH
jgi:hypothetical protein